jgi:hypothetical protein
MWLSGMEPDITVNTLSKLVLVLPKAIQNGHFIIGVVVVVVDLSILLAPY